MLEVLLITASVVIVMLAIIRIVTFKIPKPVKRVWIMKITNDDGTKSYTLMPDDFDAHPATTDGAHVTYHNCMLYSHGMAYMESENSFVKLCNG